MTCRVSLTRTARRHILSAAEKGRGDGMKQSAKKILNAALDLSEPDRVKVAEELLATLDGKPQKAVDAAWAEEIERRTREIEQGKVKPVPWSTLKKSAMRRARAKT
jgi:putative addiction module component (TIGR02574 family)